MGLKARVFKLSSGMLTRWEYDAEQNLILPLETRSIWVLKHACYRQGDCMGIHSFCLKRCTTRTVSGLLAIAILGLGCSGTSKEAAKEGTEAASQCSSGDLIAQCPPNTIALLQADAEAVCNEEGSVNGSADLTDTKVGAEVKNACFGKGTCRVVCELPMPCKFGIESISAENGIICRPPPEGCGDGICGSGETPENCAPDLCNRMQRWRKTLQYGFPADVHT